MIYSSLMKRKLIILSLLNNYSKIYRLDPNEKGGGLIFFGISDSLNIFILQRLRYHNQTAN